MIKPAQIPSLEDRFLEPQGWRWHSFKNRAGAAIRFGSVYPESRIPAAVVVILPGRTEFIEKYFETARDLAAKNLAVWIMDWQGQGKSSRFSGVAPEHGHAPDFEVHVEDLHQFILGYVKHACVHPDVGRIPMVMLAQSMGGNIGLRFLHKYPGMFECAVLCSPMLGLLDTKKFPRALLMPLVETLNAFTGWMFAPGQKKWNAKERKKMGAALTSDETRAGVHDAWMRVDPALRMGGVTCGWLYHALTSCQKLEATDFLKVIKTPCILTTAGHETLVDNAAIARAAGLLPAARLLEFPESGHEILMETDAVRNAFLDAFHQMIKETIIDRPETLKPF